MTGLPDLSVLKRLPPDGVTAKDYEALPEDISRRIEIVDGAIVVTPAPRRPHQDIAWNLTGILKRACRPDFRASMDVDLRLHDELLINRRPDIVVYDADLPNDELLRPEHCRLVVEVLSPGSMEADKIVKPYEYATAGIPHFWRVENPDDTGPKLTIFRYWLDPETDSYTLIGTDTGHMTITQPFQVSIDDFADLLS